MKLSQLSTERLAEVLCDLTPPLCRIAGDGRVVAALDSLARSGEDQPPLQAAAEALEALAPLLLTGHREDLFAVLSVLTEKTPRELRDQSALATLRDLQDCWDGDLSLFFTSAGAARRGTSSTQSPAGPCPCA